MSHEYASCPNFLNSSVTLCDSSHATKILISLPKGNLDFMVDQPRYPFDFYIFFIQFYVNGNSSSFISGNCINPSPLLGVGLPCDA